MPEPVAGSPERGSRAREGRRTAPDDRGFIRQPHGGALLPFTPARGAAAARSSVRAARKQALAILAEGTPEASRRLLALMSSTDERVAAVACQQVLDRALGKPDAQPQTNGADSTESALARGDVQFLTPDERAELMGAIEMIRRLSALAQSRAYDETIEGKRDEIAH